MAVMLGNLYDALKSAGAEDEKARQAAAEIAAPRFANLEGDVALPKWVVGFNMGLTVLVAGVVLRLGGIR